jgi:hypothetical protein
MRACTASGNVIEPAAAPLSPRFYYLNPCEYAIAASYAGAVFQLQPIAGIDSARPLLFSGDALSYVSIRKEQPEYERVCKTKCDYSAASLLYPYVGGPRQPLDRQL